MKAFFPIKQILFSINYLSEMLFPLSIINLIKIFYNEKKKREYVIS